ncbi:histidine phosphatase family protein [Candidatus Tisiphia endosymbiont of Sialis lutaria]|uniref:histidine phosphatase family protein n=1 Tax=Candidatus Tisiphia endosymbiont of Sialis lutaria TaxID=2029164 RepID=UPI00312C8A3E
MSLTKKFIFVRHGSTDWNMDLLHLGFKDYQLNLTGIKEARNAAITISEYLKKIHAKKATLISSNLNRAKETAQIISDYNKLPIFYNSNLNERYFGEHNNKLITPEEETSFDRRVATTILDILLKKHDNLIIVSHLEVFKSIQKTLINNYLLEYIQKGQVMVFTYNNSSQWSLGSIVSIMGLLPDEDFLNQF